MLNYLAPNCASADLTASEGRGLAFQQDKLPLSTPGTTAPQPRNACAGAEEKPGFRTKTVAPRITPEELGEVEIAAERDGKTLAEWLRDLALKAARQRPADPMELLLSEQSATRYMLLNLFHATAQANAEGKHLLAESVLKIRDQANARKLADARKMIESFHVEDTQESQDESQSGASREPSDAVSESLREGVAAPVRDHLGAISARSPRLRLAGLDAHAAPKVLSRHLCTKLH